MIRRIFAASLTAAALCSTPVLVSAQEVRVQAQPIAEDAPTAKVAVPLGKLFLTGDRPRIEAYLKEHATEAFRTSADFQASITRVLDALKQGARVVVGQDGFEGRNTVGVGIALSSDESSPPSRAIVVRMEPAAPHRITGLNVTEIQTGD